MDQHDGVDPQRELEATEQPTPWLDIAPDELIRGACTRAAETVRWRGVTPLGGSTEWPLESYLETALEEALIGLGVPAQQIGARRVRIEHDWDPLPDGLDLYVRREPEQTLWITAELKVGSVGETLWDLYKLLASLKLPGASAAYLIVAAKAEAWSDEPCAELFPTEIGESRCHDTPTLFRDNARNWAKDLHQTARLRRGPSRVRTSAVIAGVPLRAYPHLELRVARVEPQSAAILDFKDGWPVSAS